MRAARFNSCSTRAPAPTELNNLRGHSFGTHVAYQTCDSAMRGDLIRFSGGLMTVILRFADKWVRWYRVLRYAKAFSLFDSVRYGLWLARG